MAGLSYIVIDEQRPDSASRAAAGLINPVTGRRMVTTWMIDELLPFAREAYRDWDELGNTGSGKEAVAGSNAGALLKPVSVVDFFPTAQMRLAFLQRFEENGPYLRLPEDEHHWDGLFRYELGYGVIEPCYLVDMQRVLRSVRGGLVAAELLRDEGFVAGDLVIGADFVRYRDIEARWVIFCDGVAAAEQGYFSRLPFAPNKGEALVIEAAGLPPRGFVFKRGMSLVPWRDGLFWVGSSYEWSFDDPLPSAVFRERTEALLRGWLRVPFRIADHLAAVRPATVERRPFVGLHPAYPAVGILNGMGTKGCSLAPFFARQLAGLLARGEAVMAEADVGRYRRVLGAGHNL